MAPLSRLFLRTRGMGFLRSLPNPTAPLPIPAGGGGGSSFLVRLGQVRSVSSQRRPLTDLSDGFNYRHVHLCGVLLASIIAWRYAELAWKKPRLEAAIEQYDEEIDRIEAQLYGRS